MESSTDNIFLASSRFPRMPSTFPIAPMVVTPTEPLLRANPYSFKPSSYRAWA